MSWVSKLKEAIICLRAGVVTLPYPAVSAPPPSGFRGMPIFDPNKCVGCGGCANNCPAREILLVDPCQEVRILRYIGRRCTYCGRCADVCPEKAITMSTEFETATNDSSDLQQDIEIFMGTCRRCGRCFKPPSPLEALMMTGYREDDIENDRWIYRSQDELEHDTTARDIEIEID